MSRRAPGACSRAARQAVDGRSGVESGSRGDDEIRFALLAAVCFAKLAHAADLPANGVPPPPNCFGSLYDWLNSSAQDCPLTLERAHALRENRRRREREDRYLTLPSGTRLAPARIRHLRESLLHAKLVRQLSRDKRRNARRHRPGRHQEPRLDLAPMQDALQVEGQAEGMADLCAERAINVPIGVANSCFS